MLENNNKSFLPLTLKQQKFPHHKKRKIIKILNRILQKLCCFIKYSHFHQHDKFLHLNNNCMTSVEFTFNEFEKGKRVNIKQNTIILS